MRRNVTVTLTLAFLAVNVAPGVADIIVGRNTRHLSFTASLSPDVARAGGRLSLVVNVVTKQRMHVYAPGTKYRAVTIKLNSHPFLRASRPVYPKPSFYVFKPLKEQVLVYSSPFKLTMDVAVGAVTPRMPPLKITGTLSYQACDDRVCYLPETVPLEWTVPVR